MIPRIKPPSAQNEIKKTLLASQALLANARSRFESALADFIGTHYVVALNRGRDALALTLQSLRLPPKSGVAIPAVCCPAVADAVKTANCTPIWTDVGLDGNISTHGLRKAIKEGAKTVVVAHLYGMPAPLSSLVDICDENKIHLIEDCAQSLGAEYANQRLGSFGKAAIFSFAFDKHLSLGLGGALATNDAELAIAVQNNAVPPTDMQRERDILGGLALLEYRFNPDRYESFLPVDSHIAFPLQPWEQEIIDKWLQGGVITYPKQEQSKWQKGVNRIFRNKKDKPLKESPGLMGNLRAFLGLQLLQQLPEKNMQRRFLAATWRDGLSGLKHFSRPAWDPTWYKPVPLRYNLMVDPLYRSKMIQIINELGMECGPFNWPTPLAPLPDAQDFCNRVINLPIFPDLSHEAIFKITDDFSEVWN